MAQVRLAKGRRQGKTRQDRRGVRVVLEQGKHESLDIIKVAKEQGADRNVPAPGRRPILDGKLQANYAVHLKPVLT